MPWVDKLLRGHRGGDSVWEARMWDAAGCGHQAGSGRAHSVGRTAQGPRGAGLDPGSAKAERTGLQG